MIIPVDVLGIILALLGIASIAGAALLDKNSPLRFIAVTSLFMLGILLLNGAGVLFDVAR